MSIIAVIPARGGSKGIPGKNIRKLGGIPLVSRTIKAAKSANLVDDVYVSSDDPEILKIAAEWGAKTIVRPTELSTDEASSEDALLHALKVIGQSEDVSVVVFLQCTSPFTSGDEIDLVISTMLTQNAQSSFSAIEDHGFIWKTEQTGEAFGVNHDASQPRKRRQDLTPQYRENGAVYAMNVAAFCKEKTRFCGRAVLTPTHGYLFEIDTEADWDVAEALIARSPELGKKSPSLVDIKAVIMDFDGVHTDDRVIVNELGEEAVICSRRDGMGIELLRKAGIKMLILSKERNSVVMRRAEKLKLDVLHGVDDKVDILERWLMTEELEWREIAFIGNDINDKGCLDRAGVSFVPNDAHPSVRADADFILPQNGGMGAVRAMAELIISSEASS